MLDGVPLGDLSTPALLGLAILLLLTGRLIPWPTWRDKVDEANRWREAYENEREARQRSDSQTEELLELAKTTHSIIAAMFGSVPRRRSGGSDVVPKE